MKRTVGDVTIQVNDYGWRLNGRALTQNECVVLDAVCLLPSEEGMSASSLWSLIALLKNPRCVPPFRTPETQAALLKIARYVRKNWEWEA